VWSTALRFFFEASYVCTPPPKKICRPRRKTENGHTGRRQLWFYDWPVFSAATVVLSRYIGDPHMIDHIGLIWGGFHPKMSLGRLADNVIIPLYLKQLSCPGFMLAAGPPSSFTTNIVGCWGGGEPCGEPMISLHSHTVPLVQWSTCLLPVMTYLGSIPWGVLMWSWDSPVTIVSLQTPGLVVRDINFTGRNFRNFRQFGHTGDSAHFQSRTILSGGGCLRSSVLTSVNRLALWTWKYPVAQLDNSILWSLSPQCLLFMFE
jgi:hypothetical protein